MMKKRECDMAGAMVGLNTEMAHGFLDGLHAQAQWQNSLRAPVKGFPSVEDMGVPGLSAILAAPFDALRIQYCVAVNAGLLESSMIGSQKLEQAAHSMESLAWGPWARSV